MNFRFCRRVLLMAAVVLTHRIEAQSPSSNQDLFDRIAALDAALFDAYNNCDLEKFAAFFPEKLEFYHDKGGLETSRKRLVESIKTNICGKVRRELVAGSMEVYPIPGYGAIEVGSHRFFHVSKDGGKETGGKVAAKFLHVWQHKDGNWKLTRVISYAH